MVVYEDQPAIEIRHLVRWMLEVQCITGADEEYIRALTQELSRFPLPAVRAGLDEVLCTISHRANTPLPVSTITAVVQRCWRRLH
jgi:hypothetical protein